MAWSHKAKSLSYGVTRPLWVTGAWYGLGHETVAVLLPGFAINWWQNQITRQLQFRDLTHILLSTDFHNGPWLLKHQYNNILYWYLQSTVSWRTWCFFVVSLNKLLNKQSSSRWFVRNLHVYCIHRYEYGLNMEALIYVSYDDFILCSTCVYSRCYTYTHLYTISCL